MKDPREACHAENRESQSCVIRIDNSFSPILPPFHSNDTVSFFTALPNLLRVTVIGVRFFFSLSFTSPKSHQVDPQNDILLGVIVFAL